MKQRTIEKTSLKMEVKGKVQSAKFRQLINDTAVLIEKNPHKDTQWVAKQLVEYLKHNNLNPNIYRIKREWLDDHWVVSIHYGRLILPHVIIYEETKTEEVV